MCSIEQACDTEHGLSFLDYPYTSFYWAYDSLLLGSWVPAAMASWLAGVAGWSSAALPDEHVCIYVCTLHLQLEDPETTWTNGQPLCPAGV